MKPAIRVENVSKCFKLGVSQAGGYRTLRESLTEGVADLWHGVRRRVRGEVDPREQDRYFWALRDISFEIQHGEIVGLIGRNGAGKSTLLKVLSRITEPTGGRAELRGRVVSLLEVGTGFHQELTGRENIFLNGAILGMSHREIQRKFDAIVAFAEVERFLDTPAKRYSSGMYIRLAFAVAAHLDAEIMVVDEVLAVGDAAFQKKCLDRIRSMSQGGSTVLFVSHNMGTVASLCKKALVLEQGQVISQGEAREQVRFYMSRLSEKMTVKLEERSDRAGSGVARIVSVQYADSDGRPLETVLNGELLKIRLGYRAQRPLQNAEIYVWVTNDVGVNVTLLSSRHSGDPLDDLPMEGVLECIIPEVSLAQGSYFLNVTMVVGLDQADVLQGAARLEVDNGPFFASGRTAGPEHGALLTHHSWRVQGTST